MFLLTKSTVRLSLSLKFLYGTGVKKIFYRRTPRKRRKTQKVGWLPLAALVPALAAAGKAAALGGISGAAGYVVKKGLEAASRKRRR